MGACQSQSAIKTEPPPREADNNDKVERRAERKKKRLENHPARPSVQSSDSGIRMRPVQNGELTQLELLKLTKAEMTTLFESYETIKNNREVIANDIYAELKARVPGAVEKMDTVQRSDTWDSIPQAVILLSGVERCILRMNDTRRLEEFIRKLVVKHSRHFGVPKEMLLAGLDVTASVVLKHIGILHQSKLAPLITEDGEVAKHIWQNCASCTTWARFFELLHKTLENVNPEANAPVASIIAEQTAPNVIITPSPNLINALSSSENPGPL